MKVDITKYWIEGVLKDKYPDFKKSQGADLNHDGQIAGNEQFGDLNKDGVVGDRGDYQLYLQRNRDQLSSTIPFFKYGEQLKVENRIHQLMYLEAAMHDAPLVAGAYRFLVELRDNVQKDLRGKTLSPKDTAALIYQVMQKGMGIVFRTQDSSSLLANIQKKGLDCDTSSFAALAIGDEVGITLNTVSAPHHVFLRGLNKDDKTFNIDFGIFSTDDFYRKWLHISAQAEANKVYLATHNDHQMEALFLANRGADLERMGRLDDALKAFDRAIQLDPNHADAHYNRGGTLYEMGRFGEALKAYDRVIQLDPSYANSYYFHVNRGGVLDELGRFGEALKAYDRAIQLDPNNANGHHNRGRVLFHMGRLDDALNAFDREFQLYFTWDD